MKVFTVALVAGVLTLGAAQPRAAQSVEFDRNGIQFHNPTIRIGEGFELKADDTARAALVIGGDATIAGRVEEDVVVILGKAQLASTAVIEGSLVVIGGTVVTTDGAQVQRDMVVVGGYEGTPGFSPGGNHVVIGTSGLGRSMRGVVPWLTYGLLFARPIVPSIWWVWIVAGVFFLVNLLLNIVFDAPVRAATTTLRATPLSTFTAGVLVMLLIGPVCFLLAVSVVGIAVIPFLLCALLIAAVLGRIAFARWIGMSVAHGDDQTSRALSMRSFLIGSALMCIAYMIPILGLVTWSMAGVFGLGASTLAFFSAYRRENPKKPKITKETKETKDAKETKDTKELIVPLVAPDVQHESAAYASAATPEPAVSINSDLPPEGGSYLPPVFEGAGAVSASRGLLAMPRARFIERLAAFALDLILVVIVAQVLNLDRHVDAPLGRLGMLLAIAYHVGFWTWKGTTVGGMICQLRVVRTDGRPVQFSEALVRGLTGIFSLVVVGLGFLWILRDPEQQAWHDRVAGTYVVKVPRDYPM